MYLNWQNLSVIICSKDADPLAKSRAIQQVTHLAHTGDQADRYRAAMYLPRHYDASGPCPCSGCGHQRVILAVP